MSDTPMLVTPDDFPPKDHRLAAEILPALQQIYADDAVMAAMASAEELGHATYCAHDGTLNADELDQAFGRAPWRK